jgi:hypothetical protein
VPFSYYQRLGAAERRIYRQSDRAPNIELGNVALLRRLTTRLEAALQAGKRAAVRHAAAALLNPLFDGLDVPRVVVKVLSARPRDHDGELHGLYTWEDGHPAQIEVWMRTAAHGRVVAFRTFLRTLLHEVCHHLDFALLGLGETFHTEGFFRREASLFRQLVPAGSRAAKAPKKAAATQSAAPNAKPRRRKPRAEQLSLFEP